MKSKSKSKTKSGKSDFFEVEDIIDKRYEKGKPFYRVRWYGFTAKQDTWEPLENLEGVEWLVKKFDAKHEKPKTETAKTIRRPIKHTEYQEMPPINPESAEMQYASAEVMEPSNKTFMYDNYGLARPDPKIMQKTMVPKKQLPPMPIPDSNPILAFDKPKGIIGLQKVDNRIEVQIEWEPRRDGIAPHPSWHDVKKLRENRNLALMLVNYYESITND